MSSATTSSTCCPTLRGRSPSSLAAAPALRLLATSREPLRIQGESRARPATARRERGRGAVHRTCAGGPPGPRATTHARRTSSARASTACRSRSSSPPRGRSSSPRRLSSSGSTQRLDLLKGTRDADERHATLRATIAWSYDLLDAGRAAALPAARGLPRRLHARDCRGSLRCGSRHARVPSRQEPRPPAHGPARRGAVLDARDDPRVRARAARGIDRCGRRSGDATPSGCSRSLDSAHLTEDDDEPFELPRRPGRARRHARRARLGGRPRCRARSSSCSSRSRTSGTRMSPEDALRRVDRLLSIEPDAFSPALRARALRVRGGALAHLGTPRSRATRRTRRAWLSFARIEDERGIAALLAPAGEQRVSAWTSTSAREHSQRSRSNARSGRFPFVECRTTRSSDESRSRRATSTLEPSSSGRARGSPPTSGWDWWRGGTLAYLALSRARSRRPRRGRARQSRSAAARSARGESPSDVSSHSTTLAASRAGARRPSSAPDFSGEHSRRERERASNRAWEHVRVERSGPLLDETIARFLAGVDDGRQLDLWDAVGVALGELELPQTEP